MRSCIYWGKTEHHRSYPKRHAFQYPLYFVCLDVAEFARLPEGFRLLGYNRGALFSLFDRDYLSQHSGPLREKLANIFTESADSAPAHSFLITVPRFLGYVFNPVSFILSFDAHGSVHSLICQVSNTFGEQHVYFMVPQHSGGNGALAFTLPKKFYVSPFLEMEGEYTIYLDAYGEQFTIVVSYFNQYGQVLRASYSGERQPLTDRGLIRCMFRYPLAALLTMSRIHWQALSIYLKTGAPIFSRPQSIDRNTFRLPAHWIFRARERLLEVLPLIRLAAFRNATSKK